MTADAAKNVADHTEEIGTMNDIEKMRQQILVMEVRLAAQIEANLVSAMADVESAAHNLQLAINSMDDNDDYSFQLGEVTTTKRVRNSLIVMKSTMKDIYADVRQYYGERGLV